MEQVLCCLQCGAWRLHVSERRLLLRGRVTLLLDNGEAELKPFDVVVQRGTNHAWVNRGTETALMAAILIDAKPL